MANTSSCLGVSAECYSLRLSAQTVSSEETGSYISVLSVLVTVGSKRKLPPDSLPVAYPKSIRSQCRQRGK